MKSRKMNKAPVVIMGITVAALASIAIAFLMSPSKGKPVDQRLKEFIKDEFGSTATDEAHSDAGENHFTS